MSVFDMWLDIPVAIMGGILVGYLLGNGKKTSIQRLRSRLYLLLNQQIAERSRIEKELKASEMRCHLFFEKAGDAIWVYEADGGHAGKIVSANQAAAKIHGYSLDELLSLGARDLDAPEDIRKKARRLEKVRRGEWIKEEIYHRKKDGRLFPMEISTGLIDLGEKKCIMAIGRDISKRKSAERELLRAHSDLEERIKARTADLTLTNADLMQEIKERKRVEIELKNAQAQLIQSGKLASIGELAAGVAHELNQPLMVIRSTAQLMRRDIDKQLNSVARLQQRIVYVEKNTKRMMNIINHLRTFSRQSQATFTRVNINTVIMNSFLMIGEQLRLRGIRAQPNLAEKILPVNGDGNQIEQVVLNLLTNARDAIEEKKIRQIKQRKPRSQKVPSPTIEICTQCNCGDNACVEVFIRDTGIGIKPEIMTNLFDPFFTTKKVGKGTGLGLSISYGIIKEHNGNIEVTETGDSGTTFKITLPACNDLQVE